MNVTWISCFLLPLPKTKINKEWKWKTGLFEKELKTSEQALTFHSLSLVTFEAFQETSTTHDESKRKQKMIRLVVD